jgi:hypothetical protein
MPALDSFDYAIVRVVPRVERAEFVNAGAIVFCRTRRYLAARIALDRPRLALLAPALDLDLVAEHLAFIPRLCAGEEAGPLGRLPQAERWHLLVAPSSTVIQPSPVHSGLCHDPAEALDHLMATMVAPPAR